MKKRIIPVVALTALLSFGAVATTLTSCGGTTDVVDASIVVTTANKTVKVGETITLETKVEGTTEISVTWSIVTPDSKKVEIVDAKKGTFKGLAEGTQKVKVSLDADPTKAAVLTIKVIPAEGLDPNKVVEISKIATTETALLTQCTVQGTIVSLYEDKSEKVSAMIYDGTGYINLYCFDKKASNQLVVGDVVKVKGTPSRYKEYYWAQFDMTKADHDIVVNKVEGATANALPEVTKWNYEAAKNYTEKNNTDGKYIEVECEAYASGNYINYKILTDNPSNDTARAITLAYTPKGVKYVEPGTKVRFTAITGDLKNSDSLVQLFVIKAEIFGLSIGGKDVIRVGETAQLTTYDGEKPLTEGVTYTSKNPEIATIDATGLVTAVAAGSATIEATVGTETVSKVITVEPAQENYDAEVTSKTVTEAATIAQDKKALYKVTGTIKSVEKASNGRFTITDGTTDLIVRDSGYNQNVLGKNEKGEWFFDSSVQEGNAETFMKVGNEITLYAFRADYTKDNKTDIQIKGAIINCIDKGNKDAQVLPHTETIMAGDQDQTKLYEIDATVDKINNAKYGSIKIKDSKDKIVDLYTSTTELASLIQDATTNKYSLDTKTTPVKTPENLVVGAEIKVLVFRNDFFDSNTGALKTKQLNGIILECKTKDVTKIELDTPAATKIATGKSLRLGYKFGLGEWGALTWKTSDAAIATVENGKVTGVADGTVKIWAETTVGTGETATTIKSNEIQLTIATLIADEKLEVKASYNFINIPVGVYPNNKYDETTLKAAFGTAIETTSTNIINTIDTASNIYIGNDKNGPGLLSGLKFGSSKKDGVLKFTTTEAVYKIEITGQSYKNDEFNVLTVNGMQSEFGKTDPAKPVTGAVTLFDASTTFEISIDHRFIVTSIKLYTEKVATPAA